jgi:2-polyprenyl-3-methyl-5-hydroxy-6-metoxy-1,4-benzoquinol methylase
MVGEQGGAGADSRNSSEIYELNQQTFTEHYAIIDPVEMADNARRGVDYLEEMRLQETGERCAWYGEIVDRIDGGRVLEIGCGSGQATLLMAQLGAREITAIEINDSTEHILREGADLLGVTDRIDVRIGDVMHMDLEGTYDVVVLRSVLHHIVPSDEDSFIHRTAELCAPDGMTRISDPAVNSKTLDAIRWALPVPGRPSSFQKEKFADWQANDEHPVRDNSTKHVTEILERHYGRVEHVVGGVFARAGRVFPDRDWVPAARRKLKDFDEMLPDRLVEPLAAHHALSAWEPRP